MYHLTVARIREFMRQPDAVFWSYFFPVLIVLALGLAFNKRQEPQVLIDIVDSQLHVTMQESLKRNP